MPPENVVTATDSDGCRLFRIRFKQRELRPADQLSEGTIKTHQVLAQVDRRGSKPCIRHGISRELFFNAELAQTRPLGPQRRQVNALGRKQRIDEGHGILDGSGFPEDPGAAHQTQKAGQHIGISIKALPAAAAEAACSSQSRATPS